jgi:uroporphyrinogen-III synthase
MGTRLAGCTVVSLRPVGGHAALRRAAASEGARVLALSPWRLVPRDDPAAAPALVAALAAPVVVFTSPAAAECAARHQPLRPADSARWLAVGSGTARALQRAGATPVAPPRMDTEGLLGLPQLQDVAGLDIGLVTAPGGRGELAPELARRGARVLRADVYLREAVPLAPRAIAALRRLDGPAWLALSSAEALDRVLDALPSDARTALLEANVVAASERLAQLARTRGFAPAVVAASARPHDLMAAAGAARAAASISMTRPDAPAGRT